MAAHRRRRKRDEEELRRLSLTFMAACADPVARAHGQTAGACHRLQITRSSRMFSKSRVARLLVVLASFQFVGAAASAPAPPRAAPAVALEGLGHSGKVLARLALPGEGIPVPLRVEGTDPATVALRWLPQGEAAEPVQAGTAADARLTAPSTPGTWLLEARVAGEARTFDTFHLLVKVPASEASTGRWRGYNVGRYPDGKGRYAAPAGFVEVTRANQDVRVSRHFRLRDFLTHDQADTWPKLVLVDERLLDKLELVVDAVAARFDGMANFHVMSGFRTPQYNARGLDSGRSAISRHTYGDAADVWIDNDGDGSMDDLDHDGRRNQADARFLARIVEAIEVQHPDLTGGIGVYPATSAHGPFVHIDARGVRARW
jgi:uncharacterized protein YcbK (DUF882 family)